MLENFQGDSWGSIPPLRMPSLLPHDLCHRRSASRWLPAVIEFQLSYYRSSLNMQYAGSQQIMSLQGKSTCPWIFITLEIKSKVSSLDEWIPQDLSPGFMIAASSLGALFLMAWTTLTFALFSQHCRHVLLFLRWPRTAYEAQDQSHEMNRWTLSHKLWHC